MDEKNLVTQLQEAVQAMRSYGERAEAEQKKFGQMLAETKQALERTQAKVDELEAKLAAVGQRPGSATEPGQPDLDVRAAFAEYARTGQVTPEARKALVEDATGEILVPAELEREIRTAIPDIAVVRGLVAARPTSSNRIRLRSLTGVSVAWGKLELGATVPNSTPTPSDEYAYVEDLTGLVQVGVDELEDSDANIAALITDAFATAIAKAEDDAFISGAGHASQQPQGVLTASGVAAVAGGSTAAITADDMIALEYGVKAQYKRRAVYIVHPNTEKALRLLKASDGHYLWQPSVVAGTPPTFNGYPVYTSDAVPTISGVAGQVDDVAVFGDWSLGYTVRDRTGIRIKRLEELYAPQGLVGFLLTYRVLGYPVRTEAFAKLQVTS